MHEKKIIKPTLSDKIADSLTVKSKPDIEDDHVFGTKPLTLSRAELNTSESEDDVSISDFRKRNVNLLSDISKKYEGLVVSRKDYEDSDGTDSTYSSDETPLGNTNNSSQNKKNLINSSSDEDETHVKQTVDSNDDSDAESDDYSIVQHDTSSNDDDDDDGDDEQEGFDISQMEVPPTEDFEHVKKVNATEEAKKGAAVRNQLLLWEGLLEMRIHLQRCVSTANQMPLKNVYDDLKTETEFVKEVSVTKTKVVDVLDKLLSLQQILLEKYPETKTVTTNKGHKKKKNTLIKLEKEHDENEEIPSDTDNEEIPSDTENELTDQESEENKSTEQQIKNTKKRKLEDFESELTKVHKSFKTFRDTTIQKWNDKTRLATATSIKTTPSNTILQQISYLLSDKEKLIKRTQLKRSEYEIFGYTPLESSQNNSTEQNSNDRKASDEYIPEIFDDSDFYHQLLRELIECKSAEISDPVQLSRQWIALQQMRSKMKRKVDTKATKGRKIKYVVHNQLVNYMAPEKCVSWTDESTNELYSSLFGKMFEQNNFGAS